MILSPTPLHGAYIIDQSPLKDDRGFFARTWCKELAKEAGLQPEIVQCNMSYNRSKGTVRGLHFQYPPFAEVKWVRCTKGALFDVIVDLRKDSPTYGSWFGIELTQSNYRSLYVPQGFAHGFQTLEDDTEMFYQLSQSYHPEAAGQLLWNDPTIQIQWPLPVSAISEKDKHSPLLSPDLHQVSLS